MSKDDIDFLELWKSRLTMDKNSGFHMFASMEVKQRIRNILAKYFEADKVQLFPALVPCGGCDETIDMIHYTYEKYNEYLLNALIEGETKYVKL